MVVSVRNPMMTDLINKNNNNNNNDDDDDDDDNDYDDNKNYCHQYFDNIMKIS